MSAKIFQFPVKQKPSNTAYRIPLYGDAEVKLTIAAINMYGDQIAGVTFFPANASNLKSYKPEFVIACINLAISSEFFSAAGKKALIKIIRSVEEVKVS